ncbi:MAG: tRNA (adenosine(37)-N6)-threonylcarbamoyltransferase complex ATPase subunit type 1 TsaE [Lysobacterales bacterium 69-70]|nr:tRNA (adenosine(37)-N6)-threonylcarbamoyltransferase complex ATPase subunit type 1 TsaE [Xanthomonadaceae bacterium]ODU32280.1 MAG: tRNA (adenosine(37)-N6)-threonylcarbamoyltransferase complex ATPase subunit type 1 TsaE [Xanthomonadaceae bacterium SCN 69-320]ODV18888.1 MAG: tRNA (adenosine(37)-N6)-threonylcarbamoyltransferase complex ATPase subunit type 1 TsaE [Xanthomonadaceae bacterium SCN 69-25]OJZ02002.1 MAG: tRNA (adenosine(37)-N6)-threonylcarbamoyltransferase complex ATPase subunit type
MAERAIHLADENAVAALAAALAPALGEGGVIHLHGDLGAGKTTFARALIAALGVSGRIKSPTYSLIESYRAAGLAIHHLDLYRIADAGELEWLGLDEIADGASLILVEWPERGGTALPRPDLVLEFAYAPVGRQLTLRPQSLRGRAWLAATSALHSVA